MTETIGEWQRRTGYDRTADQIAGLPEVEHDEPLGEVVIAPKAPVALLERTNAGLTIELFWDGGDEVHIAVTEGESKAQIAVVPPDKAMDAYWHPYCYLPAA